MAAVLAAVGTSGNDNMAVVVVGFVMEVQVLH